MFAAIFFVALALLYGGGAEAACGHKGCPSGKAKMINVHLVPHTHDDVGWLKTVDQYYYGSKDNIQHAGVQYILDSVITELTKDKARKFIWVESLFFFKWWQEQTSKMQSTVKNLVQNGQLEFTGGAWSMNDEAAVHYQSVIDQFSLGLKELKNTFGTCGRPSVGWQIDPFGHSREMASLFAQMGFDGQFFARIDWRDKSERFENRTAEMIWQASDSLGERSELFAAELYNHYSAPPGFCFDTLCSDEPIIDGPIIDNNVDRRVNEFLAYTNKMATHYRTSELLMPMGDDFNYENAVKNFKNMDKLINYVNARQKTGSKVNVFYSTPACYLYNLHKQSMTWPVKKQDFFPYSTDPHTYWTGYFTSRPTQKRFERDGNHFLQVAKQLTAMVNGTDSNSTQNLNKLREVMGIMQHHDAITGTEKQPVAYDYARLMTDGLAAAELNTRSALRKLTNITKGEFETCRLLNISVCHFTAKDANNVAVCLFNPKAHTSTEYVRIPVRNGTYKVRHQNGAVIASELVPVPKEVISLAGRSNTTKHELVFEATVDKLACYYVTGKATPKSLTSAFEENGLEEVQLMRIDLPKTLKKVIKHLKKHPRINTVVQTRAVKLTFSESGHLMSVQMNNVTENIRQDFYYYKGAAGNNMVFANRSSGAYIFRPNGTEVLIGQRVKLTIYKGRNLKEVHQRFNDYVSQTITIYEDQPLVEFRWLVDRIPIDDGIGKEIITRFSSNITNNGVFWTDSNGREMMRRVLNEREDFKANMTESVSGNYYPVTTRIALQNKSRRMALLTDRAQGGSSLKNGTLELMLHRRLLRDDAFGVGEALNETEPARGKLTLIIGSPAKDITVAERNVQLEMLLPLSPFFSSNKPTSQKPAKVPSFASLPSSIHLLTLEPYASKQHLLRLENFLDHDETVTITFNLRKVFDELHGDSISETTLDGNMALGDMKRLKFIPDGTARPKPEYYTSKHKPLSAKRGDSLSKFDVIFEPMQIRTFIIKQK